MAYEVLPQINAGQVTQASHFNQIRENMELSAGSLVRSVESGVGLIIGTEEPHTLTLANSPAPVMDYLAVMQGSQIVWHPIRATESSDIPTRAQMDARYLLAAERPVVVADKSVIFVQGSAILAPATPTITQQNGANIGLSMSLTAVGTTGYTMRISWTGSTPVFRDIMIIERSTESVNMMDGLPDSSANYIWATGSRNRKSAQALQRSVGDFDNYITPVIGTIRNNTPILISGTFSIASHNFIVATMDNPRRAQANSLYDLEY